MLSDVITQEQWQHFEQHGYVKLGQVDAEELAALQQRIDDPTQDIRTSLGFWTTPLFFHHG